MTMREKLEEDITQAMRDRDKVRLEALRFLKAKIQDVEKPLGKTLDDPGMLEAIGRQVSDRRDSIRMFEQGGRDDLVAKESAELAILITYLPPQLSPEELAQLVSDVIKEVGATSARDKGKVMGKLMPQVKGKADGNAVNEVVTQLLESGTYAPYDAFWDTGIPRHLERHRLLPRGQRHPARGCRLRLAPRGQPFRL